MEAPNYLGSQYRLRAGSPMPTMTTGDFVLHTFMSEVNEIEVYLFTQELPHSTDFRGQGGPYMSANFSRLLDRGGNSFQGKTVKNTVYIEEIDWAAAGGI